MREPAGNGGFFLCLSWAKIGFSSRIFLPKGSPAWSVVGMGLKVTAELASERAAAEIAW